MKKLLLSFIVFVFIVPIFGAAFTSSKGDLSVTAQVLQMTDKSIKAKNNIYLVSKPAKDEKLSVKCNQLEIKTEAKAITSANDISECVFSGNVIVRYEKSGEDRLTCLAFSNTAYYDSKTEKLVLTGNVKIDYISENGAKLSAKGKKAVIDMREITQKGDVLFSIEGDDKEDARIIDESAVDQ